LRFILNNERRSFKGKQDTNDMPAREDGEYELILGNKQLLGVLFIVIVLLGVFFAMGFLAGRSTTPVVATTAPQGALKTIDPPVESAQSVDAAGPAEPAQAGTPPPAKVEPAPEPPPPVKAEIKLPEVKPTAPPVTLQGGVESATDTAALPAPATGSYLQVAATSLKDGQGMLGMLKRNGHAGTLMAVPNQAGLVRVLVGPMASKEAVAAARDKLRELGIENPMPRTIQ
jgi:cell division septation protein DedD